jgi:hypothetical protein
MASPRPLGMVRPSNDRHRSMFPLTAGTMPLIPTPVVLGVNWYHGFDDPVKDGAVSWIGRGTSWGGVRGGHAICLKPPSLTDPLTWWRYYDQGNEGACVGFAVARMMSLLNRKRYSGQRLYEEARRMDEWDGEDYSGTSVRAGCDVARKLGMWPVRAGTMTGPIAADGIAENRWAMSVEDIAACLSPGDAGAHILSLGYVIPLNSWGNGPNGYPHMVRLPLEALDRLVFGEEGEATVVVDRR